MDHFHKIVAESDELKRINQTKRILLIGEDKGRALSTIIEREGYHLIHCRSVHEAWNSIYPCRPVFIVLRLDRPERTALSEFRECQVLAEGTPIIVTTADYVNRVLMEALKHRSVTVLAISAAARNLGHALRHEDATDRHAH